MTFFLTLLLGISLSLYSGSFMQIDKALSEQVNTHFVNTYDALPEQVNGTNEAFPNTDEDLSGKYICIT